jgi:uncharacterized protein (TIGR03066 family)
MKSRLNRPKNKQGRTPSRQPWKRPAPPSSGTAKLQLPAGQLAQPGPVRARSRRKLLLLVLVGLVAGVSAWFGYDLVFAARVPAELVGKWVITEGPQEGATFDFYRNGTMIGKVNAGGNEAIVNARIHVEDNKIYSTTQNPNTGQDETMVLVIRTLTAKNLVVEDQQGKLLNMERAE